MNREYFYQKAREKHQRSLTELQKKKDNVEYHLRKNPSTSYDKIPNMNDALSKVRNGKNKDVSFDQEYERLTNSSYKYK